MNERAGAVILKDGQVLLLRRYVTGRGEYWVFPGGGVEEGETVEQAMVREVKEEVGLDVTEYRPLFDFFNEFTLNGKYPPRQEYFFLVTGFTGAVVLGGEEAERMNDDDQYYPTWVSVDRVTDINLKPEEAKNRLLKFLDV